MSKIPAASSGFYFCPELSDLSYFFLLFFVAFCPGSALLAFLVNATPPLQPLCRLWWVLWDAFKTV